MTSTNADDFECNTQKSNQKLNGRDQLARKVGVTITSMALLSSAALLTFASKVEANPLVWIAVGSGLNKKTSVNVQLNEALTDVSVSEARIKQTFGDKPLFQYVETCRELIDIPEKVDFLERERFSKGMRTCINDFNTMAVFGKATIAELPPNGTYMSLQKSSNIWKNTYSDDLFKCREATGLAGAGKSVEIDIKQAHEIWNCIARNDSARFEERQKKLSGNIKLSFGILSVLMLVSGVGMVGYKKSKKSDLKL